MSIDPFGIAASDEWIEMEAQAQRRFDNFAMQGKKPDKQTRVWIAAQLKKCTYSGMSPPLTLIRLVELALETTERRQVMRRDGKGFTKEILISASPKREGEPHLQTQLQYLYAVELAAELFEELPQASEKISKQSPHYGKIHQISKMCGVDYSTAKQWIQQSSFREAWREQQEMIARQQKGVERWKAKYDPDKHISLRVGKLVEFLSSEEFTHQQRRQAYRIVKKVLGKACWEALVCFQEEATDTLTEAIKTKYLDAPNKFDRFFQELRLSAREYRSDNPLKTYEAHPEIGESILDAARNALTDSAASKETTGFNLALKT